jgi:WD40 repeat protein
MGDASSASEAAHQPRRFFDTATWQATGEVTGISVDIGTGFSPDGKRMVTVVGKNALVWDLANSRELAGLHGHSSGINGASFSPDSRLILTVSDDKTGRLWNAESGATLVTLEGHASEVRKGVFSLDGAHVVTISSDGEARLWRTDGGSFISSLGRGEPSDALVLSPGGRTISRFSSREMTEFDLENGKTVTSISLHEGSQYGDDSDYVSGPFANLVSSNDRLTMVSGDALWRMPWSTQDYVDQVKTMLPRCLTQEERKNVYLDPDPPAWCVEMEKWPYNTSAWKQWLVDRLVGRRAAARP